VNEGKVQRDGLYSSRFIPYQQVPSLKDKHPNAKIKKFSAKERVFIPSSSQEAPPQSMLTSSFDAYLKPIPDRIRIRGEGGKGRPAAAVAADQKTVHNSNDDDDDDVLKSSSIGEKGFTQATSNYHHHHQQQLKANNSHHNYAADELNQFNDSISMSIFSSSLFDNGSRNPPQYNHHHHHDNHYDDNQTLDISYLNVKYDPRFKLSPLLPSSPQPLLSSHDHSYNGIDSSTSSSRQQQHTSSSSMYSSQSSDGSMKDISILNAVTIQKGEQQQQQQQHPHNHPHHRNSIVSSTLSLPLLTPPIPHGREPPLIKQQIELSVKNNPLQSSASPVVRLNTSFLFQDRFNNNDHRNMNMNMNGLSAASAGVVFGKATSEQLRAVERQKNDMERMKLRKILSQSMLWS